MSPHESHHGFLCAGKGTDGIGEDIFKALDRVVEQLGLVYVFLTLKQLDRGLAPFVDYIGGGNQHLGSNPVGGVYLDLCRLYAFLCQFLVKYLPFLWIVKIIGIDKFVLDIFVVCPELVQHLLRFVLETLEIGWEFSFQIDAVEYGLIDFFEQALGRLG